MGRSTLARVGLGLVVAMGVLGATAAAQSPVPEAEAVAPTAFHGRLVPGREIRPERLEVVDGRTRSLDAAWSPTIVEMSDPRLDGTAIWTRNADEVVVDGELYGLATVVWRIENEDGAWQGTYPKVEMPGQSGPVATVVLHGEGAYEGLVAVWQQTGTEDWQVQGVIFPFAPPEAPSVP